MKQTLDQLTIGQFIELVSGNTKVLFDGDENVAFNDLAAAVRNIIFEYKEIADTAGIRSYITEIEDLAKAKIAVMMFSICDNLIALKAYDKVKEILDEYGMNVMTMSDKMLKAVVKSNLEKARKAIERIKESHKDDGGENINVKREFDSLTAAMMAHFKFQIDTNTMRATLYASLVARYNREVKAQLAAMNKK